VTTAGTNESAAADDKQDSVGGGGATSPPKAPDEGCKVAVKQVEEAFVFQTQCHPSNFTPLSCTAQGVASINYFAKVDVQPCGVYGFAHLRIDKGLGNDVPATLNDVELDVEMNTTLEYFSIETTEEATLEATLGAAMENAGEEILGSTLGWWSRRRGNSCKPADADCPPEGPRGCCSKRCHYIYHSYRRIIRVCK
jgi:hypothetical protein